MDIRAYIESGDLEAYVLGALSAQDAARVAADVARYPELALEVEAIEAAMIAMAEAGAVPPPPQLQDQIWNKIKPAEQENGSVQRSAKVIPMDTRPRRQFAWAAVWVGLLLSIAGNIYLWNSNQSEHQLSSQLALQMDTLRSQQSAMTAAISNYRNELDMVNHPGMKAIMMTTTDSTHPMTGMVYWDKAHAETYVSVNHMPPPPSGKQYQFWVIDNGKPVSLGTIPTTMDEHSGVMKIDTAVHEGQAFAISLENMGGNPTPTQVFVVGAVQS